MINTCHLNSKFENIRMCAARYESGTAPSPHDLIMSLCAVLLDTLDYIDAMTNRMEQGSIQLARLQNGLSYLRQAFEAEKASRY